MLKCTKFDFGWGSPPRLPSWIKGVLLLRGREGKGEGKRMGGEGRAGEGRKGREGREGRRPFW